MTVKLYQSKRKAKHWWKQKTSFNYPHSSFKEEKNPKAALILEQICSKSKSIYF